MRAGHPRREGATLKSMNCTVCVVGSGPAGAFLAVSLAELGHNVLIIETGKNEPNIEMGESISSTSVEGGASLRFGFSKQLGGTSNLWAGRVAPLEIADFKEWPISFQDLLPFYTKAADIMDIPFKQTWFDSTSSFNEDTGLLKKLASPKSYLEEKKFIWTSPPFRTAQYLRNAKRKFKNLRIMEGLHADKLIQQNDEIISLITRSEENSKILIKAEYYVLAAGGLETPRILLNSKSKSKLGIGNKFDRVGKNLQTHPKANIGLLTLKERIKTSHPLFSDQRKSLINLRSGIGLTAATLPKANNLNHYVQLSPATEFHLQNAFESAKNSKIVSGMLFLSNARLVSYILHGGLRIFNALGRISGLQQRAKIFVVRGFFDQHPSLENKLELSKENDRFGIPKIDITWSLQPEDKNSIIRFLNLFKEAVEQNNLGELDLSIKEDGSWPVVGIHSHFIGTTGMGINPETSVVDPNCKVHEASNLFISGPSVFTTGGYANPFFTTAALSLRIADHLNTVIEAKSKF